MFRPTNHRNSRLYSNCSISIRSLRMVYSTCSNKARSNFSGGIDERPIVEYMCANFWDNFAKMWSVIWRMARKGWSAGTRCSGDT